MIELFLTKIASIVFKKALSINFIKPLATAYSIYSVVDTISDIADCIETTNDCGDLGVSDIKVVSNTLAEPIIEQLIDIGSHSFSVEKTSSGIYLASRLAPSFKVPEGHLPSGVFAGGRSSFAAGGSRGFSTGGRGGFSSGGRKY